MPINVDVPALGESVREAVLIKWHKADGEPVAAAEPIAELETDKANVDVPAPTAGVLRHVKEEGATVAIGDTIARIDEAPARARARRRKATAKTPPRRGRPQRRPGSKPIRDNSNSRTRTRTRTADLRPSVRRIVEENKLDPSTIKGSRARGQITKEDATQATQQKAPPPTPSPAPRRSISAPTAPKRVPMSKIRKKIAEVLVEAQHTAAILTTFNEVDMSAIIELRAKFKEKFEKIHGVGLGFMSFFARATVLAGACASFPTSTARSTAVTSSTTTT